MTQPKTYIDQDITSHWPLPTAGIRQITPSAFQEQLHEHPLSSELYPLAMGFYPKASHHHMRRRTHNSYLLIYCTAGKGQLTAHNEQFHITGGNVILLPPGLAHSYESDLNDPWTIYWVHFNGEKADAFSKFLNLHIGPNPVGIQSRLIGEFDELLNIRRQGLSLKSFIQAANHLKMLLSDVAVLAIKRRERLSAHMEMNELLEYMQDHIDRDLDLGELAQLANMSKYHFIRRFKESTGNTPINHFIQLKMERACHLLDTSDAAIKIIAAQLGFTDPLYFSRQFRKVTGTSPQEYRKAHAT